MEQLVPLVDELELQERSFKHAVVQLIVSVDGMLDYDFVASSATESAPVGMSVTYLALHDTEVRVALERAFELASEKDIPYIYIRESDVVPTPDMLSRLISLNVDVVGAVYTSKDEHPVPLVFQKGVEPYTAWFAIPGSPVQVLWCGIGGMLIKTSALAKVSKPWMPSQSIKEFGDGLDARLMVDFPFCINLNRAGVEVWVDTGVCCRHRDTATGTAYYFDTLEKVPAVLTLGAKVPTFAPGGVFSLQDADSEVVRNVAHFLNITEEVLEGGDE